MLGYFDIKSRVHVFKDDVLLRRNEKFRVQGLPSAQHSTWLPSMRHFQQVCQYLAIFVYWTYSHGIPISSLVRYLILQSGQKLVYVTFVWKQLQQLLVPLLFSPWILLVQNHFTKFPLANVETSL